MDVLRQFEYGQALIPAVLKRRRGRWHAEDLIEPPPGRDSDWRQAVWRGAQAYLGQDEVDVSQPGIWSFPVLKLADTVPVDTNTPTSN